MLLLFSSVQFSSVAQSCPTLCNPLNCSTPGFLFHQQLPEFTQTHVHWVSGAIQTSQALSSPSPSVTPIMCRLAYFILSHRFLMSLSFFPPNLAFCCLFWWDDFHYSIFSSVQFSRSVMSDSLRPHESQHTRPPCPSPTPRVHSDSRPLSQWCHPAISSSVFPFSSCPQSESFPMS